MSPDLEPLHRYFGATGPDGRPGWARLAELVSVNDGEFQVSGWGIIACGGLYGRIGLTANEAHELNYLCGVLQGLALALGHVTVMHEVKRRIQAEWARMEAMQESPPPPSPAEA